MELLQYTASLPRASGQWNSCNALPHCMGAVGSGTPAYALPHRLGAVGGELLQCAGPPAGGIGSPAQEALGAQLVQCTATLPGVVGSAIPTMHCLTA